MVHLEQKLFWRKLFWAAGLATVAIFLLNFYLVGFGVFGDGLGYYLPLRSFLFDGDLRISDEYQALADSASRLGQGLRVSGTETEYSLYTLGMAVMLAPWFIVGHGLAWVVNQLGGAIALNGLTWPYELAYCLGSVLFGIAGLLLCHRTALRFFSPFAATLAVLGIWFATPLTFYITLETSMSHGVSQFLISLFFYLCLTIPWGQRRAHPWIAGLVLGLATLVRPQNILFGILPLGIAIRKLMERRRNPVSTNLVSTFRPLAIIGIATVGLVVCQAAVYYLLHGSVTNIPYLQSGETAGYGQSFNWMNPQILSVLFSGFHGLVSWHPLVGLSLLGLALAHGRDGRLQTPLRWILLLAFALQLYLISAWWSWWQGASFGGRMFSSCSAIFVLGLAALWDRWPQRTWRGLAVGLTLLAMAWNALLVMQYESAMIPPEAAVPLGELYRNQLSALPYFVNHILNR